MDNYKNVILEAGINHLGKISEAKKILNFFLNSKFKSSFIYGAFKRFL